MSSAKFRRAISSIYDAALVPELWPAALQSVMDQLGAVGAGYSLFDRRTERVEWLSQSGSLVGREADYFSYYHELDRYRPILEARPTGEWLQISECLPETVLRRDEWYNDYLLEAGIDDALSVRTFENASHIVVFGVSHGIDQAPFTASGVAVLQVMLEPLAKAAGDGNYGYTTWTFWPPATEDYLIHGMEQVWLKQISSEDYLKIMQATFAKEMADGKVPEIAAR